MLDLSSTAASHVLSNKASRVLMPIPGYPTMALDIGD